MRIKGLITTRILTAVAGACTGCASGKIPGIVLNNNKNRFLPTFYFAGLEKRFIFAAVVSRGID
jgi:TctA family transporter